MSSIIDKNLKSFHKEFVLNLSRHAGFVGEDEAGKLTPVKVPKSWGHELIFLNTNLYCMKLLHINHGCNTSTHFHLNKHETMFVIAGELWIETINKEDKDDNTKRTIIVRRGEAFVIPPGFVHKLICGPYSDYTEFIECSTFSTDTDSIRLID